ncbi:glycosyltransferase family 4 protein [Dehalococcoidia bacterium]|nr:glycosyltransferase family 4 protein [Dehalococcoidia bacterium]
MRVLILTQFYYPEPELRNHILARQLVSRGHEVVVITSFPNYPHGKFYPGYSPRHWKWELDQGVRVLRLPLYPDHSSSFKHRALCYGSFAVTASLLGSFLSGGFDVLFVYHPPLTIAFPALLLSLIRRVPFIFEIQDLWPESPVAAGMLKNKNAQKIVTSFANLVYKKADAITVISPGFKRSLIEKGIAEEKIHVIHNWVDQEIFFPVNPDPNLAIDKGLDGKFNVIYAGNMGTVQALHNVLDSAETLKDLSNLQFVFIGDGLDLCRLVKSARDRSLDNVLFLPRQPMTTMAHFNALADILLIHLSDDPLFSITIPSKTQASLASGRPIVACVSGDAADMIIEAGAGLTASPGNSEELSRAIREMYNMEAGERQALGESGRKFFSENLTSEVLIDKYEALLQNLCDS